MCLELEADHKSDQSGTFPDDRNLEAVLRENRDPATDAGKCFETNSPNKNTTRRRRISKRNKRNITNQGKDDVVKKEENEDQSPEVKTCELCRKRFHNSHDLTLHLKEHNSNSNNGSTHECTLCHKVLSSKSSLDRHALVHTGYKPHKCEICGVLFTTNGNMNRHIRIHENESKKKTIENTEVKTHACSDNCQHGFSDLYEIDFSSNKYPQIARMSCERKRRCPPPKRMKFSDDVAETLRVYSCDVCSHCFPCARTLEEHNVHCSELKNCHLQTTSNKECESVLNDENTGCYEALSYNHCHGKRKREASKNLEYMYFKAIDLFRPGIACPVTPPSFKESNNVAWDTSDVDSVELPEECTSEESFTNGELIIDESINSNSSQSNDTDYDDLTPEVASCISAEPSDDTCNQNTKEIPQSPVEGIVMSLPSDINGISRSSVDSDLPKGNLRRKKRAAGLNKRKAFRIHSFKSHIQKKTYKCDICDYATVDKSTLQRHIRTHTGARPFKCDICQYAFTTKTNTQRHIRKKHSIYSRFDVKKYAVYNHERSETNSSANAANENTAETTCKYCKVDFGNSRLLKHHLRSLRDSCAAKPFTCKICRSGFSTKNNCVRHIINVHAERKEKVKHLITCNDFHTSVQLDQATNVVNNEVNTHDERTDGPQINFESRSNNMQNGNQNLEISDINMQNDNQNLEISDISMQNGNQNLEISDINMQNGNQNMEISDISMQNGNQSMEISDINTQNGSEESLNIETNDINTSDIEANPNADKTDETYSSDKDGGEMHMSERSYPLGFSTILQEVLETSDFVSAVDGLMSLSKSISFETQPLDLSIRPMDLSSKDAGTSNQLHSREFTRFPPSYVKGFREVPPVSTTDSRSSPNLHELNCSGVLPQYLASLQHMAQNLNYRGNDPISASDAHFPRPLDYSITSKPAIQNSYTPEMELDNQAVAAERKVFKCDYCCKTFTLKSNKQRHIKTQHPKCARPPRSRNFIPMFQEASCQKQIPNVSDVTKDRLRSVLIPKVFSSSCPNGAILTIDGEVLSSVAEKTEEPSEYSDKSGIDSGDFLKDSTKNDYENNDLASVSSVINTANSKEINKLLKDVNLTDSQPSVTEKDFSDNGGVEPKTNGNPSGKAKQLLDCNYCDKVFTYSSARERHIATHTGEKLFFCYKCNTKFSTKSNKERHERRNCCEKTKYRSKSISNPLKDSTKSHANVPSQVSLRDFNHQPDNKGTDVPKITDNQVAVNTYFIPGILNNSFHASEHSSHVVNTSMHVLNVQCESLITKENLECKFCNNTYKNSEDLTNHMKELHPLEYKSLIGETFDHEDTIQSWKKTISGKRKTV